MTFNIVNNLNPIGEMKIFTEPNCSLCMEEFLTTLKKLCEKCVTVVNTNLGLYGAFRYKTTFCRFFISTYDPV